ncbi:DUF2461 domain-containing protein [Aequorivita sp. H23M31]|uniref:DUF2461 domain-containing protein n=1 Tax=Aequorivita ciconiae TaxID=2494375 RepID=A0A410G1D6_9FLAO|nr:DUF2461 domain-containing protein [Aequorivita sp. H23M31]QAA81086.1 DUF2461 domain-containing protein [Aequorivita sp. H23M31]
MSISIPKNTFDFLLELRKNNNREWMQEHRKEYLLNEEILKSFYSEVEKRLVKTDEIAKVKIFRINRDLRFRKDKTPYNSHRSVSYSRAGEHRRGGYYFRLDPGNCYMAGGFFDPEREDLLRIRKEFEIDSSEIREILNEKKFKNAFGNFVQSNAVKSAPKGFDKEDPNIDLIKLKSFVVKHTFSDEEVQSENFIQLLMDHFLLLRPFFDYMSHVLTTDLNGVSLIEDN